MTARIEAKIFALNERIAVLHREEAKTGAELDMLRSLEDDYQRDAVVSGHFVDRADARRATADKERFERVLRKLRSQRTRLEEERARLLARLDS